MSKHMAVPRERLTQNLRIAQDFKPLNAGELEALRDKCRALAAGKHQRSSVPRR